MTASSSHKAGNSIMVLLLVGCFLTLGLTFLHAFVLHGRDDAGISFFDRYLLSSSSSLPAAVVISSSDSGPANDVAVHKAPDIFSSAAVALNCDAHGGPSPEIAAEMVYWKDIESDEQYSSPFEKTTTITQYMTFEPDGGGWNNIRMSMETNIAMALASGRTLVLPPEQRMYLLNQGGKDFSFQDFFCFDCITSEHSNVKIMSMEEFLTKEGLSGNLRDIQTGKVAFPPHNRTNWNGMSTEIKNDLNPYLRNVALNPDWNPEKCVAAFPQSNSTSDIEELKRLEQIILQKKPDYRDYVGHPVDVDGSTLDRLKEMWAARDKLCIYDEVMQNAPLLHFHGKKGIGARLLVHYYAFLFFQDWRLDLWMKRFVRDHIRYIDELQCAAARVVNAVRQRARERRTSSDGEFDAFHIRRGDFQYKKTRIEATDIYENTKDLIPEGATVYIGTDERKKEFFDPLQKHWDLVFLDDFKDLLTGINANYYGMIDTLITSRGRTFVGCWFSTFTGYINRLRGYHSDKQRLPGYEDGVIDSYYYVLPEMKHAMREYVPVKKLLYAREYPTAWRLIDKGVPHDSIDTAR